MSPELEEGSGEDAQTGRRPSLKPWQLPTGRGNRAHWRIVRERQARAGVVERPLRKCPESGKATGQLQVPRRRKRCLVCGRLVAFRVSRDELVVVQLHYWPKADD